MENRAEILKKHFAKSTIGGTISINDLREKEFNGKHLSKEEVQALANFDRFRLNVLNAQTEEDSFHKRYQELQVMANLDDYKEFLKEKYFL
ncbi:MAG: hypothetical protein JNL69_00525 [Bacteroidia bacterium]|nr:hypothetical protein [Bacteroidia bacterium]